MPEFQVTSLDDPLLEPFRGIRNRNWTEHSGWFIAEGPLLVERLIGSPYPLQSVLLDQKYYAHYAAMVPDGVPLLIVDHGMVESIVGFHFHRGVLGCGLRQPLPLLDESFLAPTGRQETLLCTVGVQDPENLGGILRSCAGLGIARVIIGPQCADPLSRRVLRVSMGNALRLQLYRSRDLLHDLHWLRTRRGIPSVATTLASDAVPLEQARRDGPLLILIGNERYGLPTDVQAAADARVTMTMELETDSLNAAVAAGIVLHYFSRLAGAAQGTLVSGRDDLK